MKYKLKVHGHVDFTLLVDVEAEDKEQALDKVIDQFEETNLYKDFESSEMKYSIERFDVTQYWSEKENEKD